MFSTLVATIWYFTASANAAVQHNNSTKVLVNLSAKKHLLNTNQEANELEPISDVLNMGVSDASLRSKEENYSD